MIPNPPHRHKGGAPQLGARHEGERGPFGVYAEDEPDDEPDSPEAGPTSHVEQQVQQRIEAAERKAAARKRDRAAFAAARSYGLARRHAARLRNLRDSERRAAETDSASATDEQLSRDDEQGRGSA